MSKGYKVGDPHPTHRGNVYEEARQEEPAVPTQPRRGGPAEMVRASDRGRHGLRDGAIAEGSSQASEASDPS